MSDVAVCYFLNYHADARNEQLHGTGWTEWELRPKEELYDIENDPNEFVNLADDPAYAKIRKQLAEQCKTQMEETDDPLLKGDIPPSETMRKKMNVKRS